MNITCYNEIDFDITCYNIITSSRKLVITKNVSRLNTSKKKRTRNLLVIKWREMVSTEEENWFGQTNKYKYQDLMIALYEKDTINMKAAHAKLGGTGVWIDTDRFTKGTRLYNPNGLFDLFGENSGQTVDEVRGLMIGWIYDNYRNIKGWTRMAMQHKNIEINNWLEDMQKTTMHGDDIALYILS